VIEADVVVAGAGPAGAAFATGLAPLRRVLLVDCREAAAMRIGESLAPAVRRLFTDMGLWDDFLAEQHMPCHGTCSAWGAAEPSNSDGLRDLDGPGWHLDRARFDDWLRRMAVRRGAGLVMPARIGDIARHGDGWRLELAAHRRRVPVRTRLLVDAGGRNSSLARRFGARRMTDDRLVCGWLHGQDAPGRQSGLTHIESEPDGWWYTAPLPAHRRVVAFYTDSDLPAAVVAAHPGELLRRLQARPLLSRVLAASSFAAEGTGGFCAAHGSALLPPAGDGWLAVGDAALSFDPLSSQGLFNALYTGLTAAEAADRHLDGDRSGWHGYVATLASVRDAYRTHLHAWYGQERRWADRPFWERRLKPESGRAGSQPEQ
jgi:flavin-dependent dehydrogenase